MNTQFVPITGLVLAVSHRAVQFNFGNGEVWIPRPFIKETSFPVRHISTWNIVAWVLEKEMVPIPAS